MIHLRGCAVPLFVASSLAAPSARGQEIDLPGVFSEIIDVRVVNVEVVVTDKDGIRIHGLGPDDFRLLVDGQDQSIDYFTEILGGEIAEPEDGVRTLQAAPALEPEGPSTSYLVFIDDYFSIARDRNRVLDAFSEDLEFLGPRDRMAVVAFDGKHLDMITSWTTNHRVVQTALRQATTRKAFGLQRLGERRQADFNRADFRSFNRGTSSRLNPMERYYATRLATQVERAINAAIATLRSFASPPGRKVMLLLSGGWPVSPAEYAAASPGGSFDAAFRAAQEQGIPAYHRLLSPLTDTANLLGYTVYPIDVPGMTATIDVSARRAVPTLGGGVSSDREYGIHDTLRIIAEQTGGRPLINSQRMHAIETVADDLRSYYWLGFTLDRQANDSRHTVKVEVLRPGLRTRSREGFVDLSRSSEVTMMVESPLLFGNPPSSRPLEIRFGNPKKVKRGIVEVPIEVGFPLDDVTMLPFEGGFAGQAEVRVTVMDKDGNRSETSMHGIDIRGRRTPAPGEMFWWESALLLRRRKHEVVVAVHDPLSGIIFSSTVEITP